MRILVTLLMIVTCLDLVFAEDRLTFNDDEPGSPENGAIEHRASRIQISNETTDTFYLVHARPENGTRYRRHAGKSRRASRFPRPSNNRHHRRNDEIKSRNSIESNSVGKTSRNIRLPQSRRKVKAATYAREEDDRDEDHDTERKIILLKSREEHRVGRLEQMDEMQCNLWHRASNTLASLQQQQLPDEGSQTRANEALPSQELP